MTITKNSGNGAIGFLDDGEAVSMGDGIFVLRQADERGVVQNVVITIDDMAALIAAA